MKRFLSFAAAGAIALAAIPASFAISPSSVPSPTVSTQQATDWWAAHCTEYFSASDAYCATDMSQWSAAQHQAFGLWLLKLHVAEHGGATAAVAVPSGAFGGSAGGTFHSSTEESWQGKNGMWFRLEDGTLQSSTDLKTWTDVAGGAWMGPMGEWYRFGAAGTLQVSKDGGRIWLDAADGTWVAQDGRLYRLDAQGDLQVGVGQAGSSLATGQPRSDSSQREQWSICGMLSGRGRGRCLQDYMRSQQSAEAKAAFYAKYRQVGSSSSAR